MDNPLQRLQAFGPGGACVAQDLLEHFNAVYDAVVMVNQRIFVFVLGTEAVAFLGKAGSVFGNVDKMPVVAFVAVSSHVVSPAGNGRKTVIAEQHLQVLLCRRREVSGGNVSDDG